MLVRPVPHSSNASRTPIQPSSSERRVPWRGSNPNRVSWCPLWQHTSMTLRYACASGWRRCWPISGRRHALRCPPCSRRCRTRIHPSGERPPTPSSESPRRPSPTPRLNSRSALHCYPAEASRAAKISPGPERIPGWPLAWAYGHAKPAGSRRSGAGRRPVRSADFQSALGVGTNGFIPANSLIVISVGEHELARTTSKQRRAAETAFNT